MSVSLYIYVINIVFCLCPGSAMEINNSGSMKTQEMIKKGWLRKLLPSDTSTFLIEIDRTLFHQHWKNFYFLNAVFYIQYPKDICNRLGAAGLW